MYIGRYRLSRLLRLIFFPSGFIDFIMRILVIGSWFFETGSLYSEAQIMRKKCFPSRNIVICEDTRLFWGG
jgi:hypothetical protein